MAEMSRAAKLVCRSAPWQGFAGKVVLPWALQRHRLTGDVLEIGCGSGAMAAAVVTRFPDVRLTATDVDMQMLETAQTNLAPFGARAEVREGDATALPVADGSFDAVLSFVMLHHVMRWEQALADVTRVLRPGGWFVGYDLLDEGIGRLVNGHDRGTRVMRLAELRGALGGLPLDEVRVRPALGGLVVRFAARKR